MTYLCIAAVFLATVLGAAPSIASEVQRQRDTKVHVTRYAGGRNEGSYVVTLAPGTNTSAFVDTHELEGAVTHRWDGASFPAGFAGRFDAAALEALRGSLHVDAIEEDGLFWPHAEQTNAPWGLARLSSLSPGSSDGSFLWYDAYDGAGTDIYIVDTGILVTHPEFGGRASHGYSAPGLNNTDENGHGTWLAGIAIGTNYGVAKGASAIAVKILGANGSGTTSAVVSGLSYIGNAAATSGRPSIVLLAFGGSSSTAVSGAVVSLTSAGIPVVVSAGNSNTDVASISPANVPSAVTVAASTTTDGKLASSNYGALVDYFAPGQGITSVWIGSTSTTQTLSGTSGSAAFVAGLHALWASQYGNFTGAIWHQDGVLTGVPTGTPNRLAVGPIQV